MKNREDFGWDYDAEIDALFEGLLGAAPLLTTGRMESMGVALSDRVKERLVERHGKAADIIVYNTGRYENGVATRYMDALPPRAKPEAGGSSRLGEAVLRLLGRHQPAAEPTPPMPRWMRLIRDRETEVERRKVVMDKVLGDHRPKGLH